MTAPALRLLAACIGLAASILLLRALEAKRMAATRRTYRLDFPRDVNAQAVTTFVGGLSGLLGPWWRRLIAMNYVVVEVSATDRGITHHLVIPHALVAVVVAHLRAALPGVRLSPDPDYQPHRPSLAAELALSTGQKALSVERAEAVMAAILAALQPLKSGETAVVQWIISPAALPRPPRVVNSGDRRRSPWLAVLDTNPALDPQAVRDVRAKQAEPLFVAAGRLGVVASSRPRSDHLLRRLEGAFHLINAPGVHLHVRALPSRHVAARVERRSPPLLSWPCYLNAAELGALIGFPAGEPRLAGLSLGGCRHLPPPPELPSAGAVLARATYPGAERPLALSPGDRLHHLHAIGPTGSGKSTLLLNLIVQDMAAGHGLVVVDPKGDLVADVLQRVPPGRVRDVIVLDPADELRPVGLNPLTPGAGGAELMVDQVVGIFHNLYARFWGPRTDDILRAALLTLATEPGMTLCEVPLLLTDAAFRSRLVGRIDEPIALEPFWGWYEALSAAERTAAIGPVLNKLRAFLLRRRIRNVIGQAQGALDFERLLAERRILLVPLAKGLLGEEAAALLGSLVVARLWQAAQGRAGLPPARRHPVFAYIDEVQDYLNLATDIGDLLAQARSLGLGLTLAHQHLGQLPKELRTGVLANARTKVVFQTTADDARVLAREFDPHLTPADLQGLGPYEVAIKPAVGGRVISPVTGITLPPGEPTGSGDLARAWSRSHHGHERDEVEAAIRAPQGGHPGAGAIGRTRRPGTGGPNRRAS